jgi:hypothetical protein
MNRSIAIKGLGYEALRRLDNLRYVFSGGEIGWNSS